MKILQLFVAVEVTILAAGCNNAKNMKTEVPEISAFPTGKSNVAYEQYIQRFSKTCGIFAMYSKTE